MQVVMRLVDNFAIPLQPTLPKLLKDDFVCAWQTSRAINVFDADQPLALVGACI